MYQTRGQADRPALQLIDGNNKKPGAWAGLGDKLLIRIFFEASSVDVV